MTENKTYEDDEYNIAYAEGISEEKEKFAENDAEKDENIDNSKKRDNENDSGRDKSDKDNNVSERNDANSGDNNDIDSRDNGNKQSEKDKKTAENKETDKKNQSSSKIVLPKSFERFKDNIAEIEKKLNFLNDDEFIKNALKKALFDELNKIMEKQAEKFAEETIAEIEKNDKNAFERVAEERILLKFATEDVEKYFNRDDITEIDADDLLSKAAFDVNEIYKEYAEIFRNNKNLKEFFEALKINFYPEDYFVL